MTPEDRKRLVDRVKVHLRTMSLGMRPKVARSIIGYAFHEVSTIVVATPGECPFETALVVNGNVYVSKRVDDAPFLRGYPTAVVVEEYVSQEAALAGHDRWVAWGKANVANPPAEIRDSSTSTWARILDEEVEGWRVFERQPI